jgi:DNA-binding NtrC family response regulator
MATSRKISPEDVPAMGDSEGVTMLTYKQAKDQVLDQFDRDYLLRILSLSQGSLQQALGLSGMHKKNFYTKIKELGLAMKDFSGIRKTG